MLVEDRQREVDKPPLLVLEIFNREDMTESVTLLAVITLMGAQLAFGSVFTWKPSNALTERENWVDSDLPCNGDYLRFDERKEAVTFLEGGLKVRKNLALFVWPQLSSSRSTGLTSLMTELSCSVIRRFSENRELGSAPRERVPKVRHGGVHLMYGLHAYVDVFFQPKPSNPSYFDAANWDVTEFDVSPLQRPRLHCQRVPGVEVTLHLRKHALPGL